MCKIIETFYETGTNQMITINKISFMIYDVRNLDEDNDEVALQADEHDVDSEYKNMQIPAGIWLFLPPSIFRCMAALACYSSAASILGPSLFLISTSLSNLLFHCPFLLSA